MNLEAILAKDMESTISVPTPLPSESPIELLIWTLKALMILC